MCKIYKLIFLLSIIGMFISCSNNTSVEKIISISINMDVEEVGLGDEVSFIVISNTNEDVTNTSKIFVNNIQIVGSKKIFELPGSYKIHAEYNSIASEFIEFDIETPPISYIKVVAPPAVYPNNKITLKAIAYYPYDINSDITQNVEFYVDDELISGNNITPSNFGNLKIKAKYQDLESDVVDVEVRNPTILPQNFTKKSVIEDFTGTWCGWCPRISYAISLVEEKTSNAFAVGVHIGDDMQNSYSTELDNGFKIQGYPTAYINRIKMWSYPEPNNIDEVLDESSMKTNSGLEIKTSAINKSLDVEIRAGFTASIDGVKMVVYILEDNLSDDQTNYTEYYGGSDILYGFKHNGVLRYSVTSVFGDEISSSYGFHNYTYNVDLSKYNIKKISNVTVLGMLLNKDGHVINAQRAKMDEFKLFD